MLLIPLLLVPLSLSAAYAKKVTTGETIYVLKTTVQGAIASDELPTECWFASGSGGEVISGTRVDLHSIQTQSAHGRVVNGSVKKVGEIISCVIFPTVPSDPWWTFPLYPGLGEDVANSPSQNVNFVNSILLNGQQYYGFGSGRVRTDPAVGGLPYPDFYLMGITATLAKLVDGGIKIVGSYTNNTANALLVTTDNLEKQTGIAVLRISEPGYTP